MKTNIKKLNSWFYRHGWHRDNRGYEQYLWKEQETCFTTRFGSKDYHQINETTISVWPSGKTISIVNHSFWRSNDGEIRERTDGQSFAYSFTPEELSKIKELYEVLNNELQIARSIKK